MRRLREEYLFSHGWTWEREGGGVDPVDVVIPHTVSRVPLAGFDDRLFHMRSVYRRVFEAPGDWRSRRIFLEFEGVMTASRVMLNGVEVGSHAGGYTPFVVELTTALNPGGTNDLAVEVDSHELADVPPFGGVVDYLTYGGIYRNVWLRIVDSTYIRRITLETVDSRTLVVDVAVDDGGAGVSGVGVLLEDMGGQPVAVIVEETTRSGDRLRVRCSTSGPLRRWDVDDPCLYRVRVVLLAGKEEVDCVTTRFGFREARFTTEGFFLNGRQLLLRGMNRHQSFPFMGYAAPDRMQRRDADILRKELRCNIVRTSHYPQSPAFLERCDEIGLLVFEEIPGWQHIGGESWKERSVDNLRRMIERDANHPSIVLWGVRINESVDDNEFYGRTNELAHRLDPTRQTGGVRALYDSDPMEDVFTINDFEVEKLRAPKDVPYMVTEYGGHTFSTKHFDNVTWVSEHIRRHAHVLSQIAVDPGILGGTAWCAFDYHTHRDFGSGDRICHHGVMDMFRMPKFAAALYKSQVDPGREIVLEPGFAWSMGDKPGAGDVGRAYVLSNCESVIIHTGGRRLGEVVADRNSFPGLDYPPFPVDGVIHSVWGSPIGDLKFEGIIGGKVVAERWLSCMGVDEDLALRADDEQLTGDGIDATRVSFAVTDRFGNRRPLAVGVVAFDVSGPGELIGENPFPLIGGGGAVWIRARMEAGVISVKARHPYLGIREVIINVVAADAGRYF